ncbi:MAG: hypothetical protein EA424_17495 [Planctomycetaceae bacterium]|nr:MAG: hypothetical protein EA424_17495 [Planctomycetaceae bacterium]
MERRASLLDAAGRDREDADGVGRDGAAEARDDPRSDAGERPGLFDAAEGRWRPRDGASAAKDEKTVVKATKMATHPPMETHQLG